MESRDPARIPTLRLRLLSAGCPAIPIIIALASCHREPEDRYSSNRYGVSFEFPSFWRRMTAEEIEKKITSKGGAEACAVAIADPTEVAQVYLFRFQTSGRLDTDRGSLQDVSAAWAAVREAEQELGELDESSRWLAFRYSLVLRQLIRELDGRDAGLEVHHRGLTRLHDVPVAELVYEIDASSTGERHWHQGFVIEPPRDGSPSLLLLFRAPAISHESFNRDFQHILDTWKWKRDGLFKIRLRVSP